MDLTKILGQIDCTEFEIKTFTALLAQAKGASVLLLSKNLNLPRPTIYGHLDSLIKKGLVRKTTGEQGTIFYTESLENILQIYNEKIKQIKEAKEDLAQLVKSGQFQTPYQPKFIFYDTPNAAEKILRDVLRSRENQTYWFWPLKEMIKTIGPDVLDNFNKERVIRNIWVNVLWPPKRKVEIKKHPFLGSHKPSESFRRVKILPDDIDQSLGFGIYGNKVAFISSKSESYGIIIESPELAQTLKTQFDYFWKFSQNYKE